MIEKILNYKNRIFCASLLIFIGVIGRITLNDLLPKVPSWSITINGITQPLFMMDLFFVIAIVSLISGLILGGYFIFIVPISIMIITDLYYGNTYIFLFTWSGFIIIGILGYLLKSKQMLSLKKFPTILGVGIGGVLLYDLWTNFGWWLGWYPHTFNGLITCYTFAVPFILWHLLSTSIMITTIVLFIIYIKEHSIIKTNFEIKSSEKYITIIATLFFMILSIIMI